MYISLDYNVRYSCCSQLGLNRRLGFRIAGDEKNLEVIVSSNGFFPEQHLLRDFRGAFRSTENENRPSLGVEPKVTIEGGGTLDMKKLFANRISRHYHLARMGERAF